MLVCTPKEADYNYFYEKDDKEAGHFLGQIYLEHLKQALVANISLELKARFAHYGIEGRSFAYTPGCQE